MAKKHHIKSWLKHEVGYNNSNQVPFSHDEGEETKTLPTGYDKRNSISEVYVLKYRCAFIWLGYIFINL